jgi:Ca2+-binding RTX toxin-like protein
VAVDHGRRRDQVSERRRSFIIRAALCCAVLSGALLVPAGAQAVKVTYGQFQPMTLDLTDDDGVDNEVGITTVTVVAGHPDAVVGDVKAGIPDPIPQECARVDQNIVRCPATGLIGVIGFLGGGNDSLSVSEDFGYRETSALSARLAASSAAVTPFVRMSFGAGADRGSDLSTYRDIWNGGSGKDRFNSGPGNDLVRGGAQNDIIDCGAGHDDVGIGGPGKRDLGGHCETVKH